MTKFKGDNGSDLLVGTNNADIMKGFAGNDFIHGNGGADIIMGGADNDYITGGKGNDVIYTGGSDGLDRVYAGRGYDTITVGANSNGALVNGNRGNDVINIRDLKNSDGIYTLNGGAGKDTVNFATDISHYLIKGGENGNYTITDEQGNLFNVHGVERLTFGGEAYVEPDSPDSMFQRWQNLDSRYVAIATAGGNPALFGNYDDATPYQGGTLGAAALAVNNDFLQLAADYQNYLDNGGYPLTDMIVKTSATRAQSLHDNVLGNVSEAALHDRGLDNPENLELFSNWLDRPYVDGYTDPAGVARFYKGLAFDFEHDVKRQDYDAHDTAQTDSELSATMTDPDHTLLVNGVPGDHMNSVVKNALGIQLDLKAHEYGENYDASYVAGSTYNVEDGVSPLNAGRADWSIAMSVEDGKNGSTLSVGDQFVKGDYDVGIWFDMDPSVDEHFVFLGNLEEIPDSVSGNSHAFQNSWNYGFGFIKDQLMEDYGVDFTGEAQFGIELRLAEVDTGDVVAINHIDVVVHEDILI